MATRTERRRVLRISLPGSAGHRADLLAVEEPLEIQIGGTPLTVTMRTPGDDIDLAAGFLFGEGLLNPSVDLRQIRMCDENVADVMLEPSALPLAGDVERATDARFSQRNFLTTSACGVCGKESIEAIRVTSRYDISADPVQVSPVALASLPDRLRDAQRVFASTGGLHAAGLFTPDGTLLVLREDVGRHNTVDKVCRALREGRLPLYWPHPPGQRARLVRAGAEGLRGRYPGPGRGLRALVAGRRPGRGGPGGDLVGFLRGSSMNVYTAAHRLTAVPAPA